MNVENAKNIVNTINNNGIVLMQTDTVFGLICSGINNTAIQKIKAIKHREKPSFGFFVKNLAVAKQYAYINDIQQQCFETVFPGHFTLILQASKKALETMPNDVFGTKDMNNETIKTIGMRIPANDFCIEVLSHFDFPLLATSANISGQNTATDFDKIDKTIIDNIDAFYYDVNQNQTNISSTIIDITDTYNAKIIRNGSGDFTQISHLVHYS